MADPRSPYGALIASRIRAQRSYPLSFRWDVASSLLVGVVEFAEVWVVFTRVPVFGGLDLNAILLVFGLSNLTFAAADLTTGHLDRIPTYIRAGTIDVFYLRPLTLIGQLVSSDFQLRRLARLAVGATVLAIGLARNDVPLDLRTVTILLMTFVCGYLIFATLFIAAAGAQFFLVNGAEVTNAFTYGGVFAAGQPAAVFPDPLKILFGYVFPTVFTGYLPAVALLGLPGAPPLLPAELVWFMPLAAGWMAGVGLLLWRLGVRHYQGAGG